MNDEKKITLVEGQENVPPLQKKYEVEQIHKTKFSYNDVTSIILTLEKQIKNREDENEKDREVIAGLVEKKEALEALGVLEEVEKYNQDNAKKDNE
jgi:hypothetical protein